MVMGRKNKRAVIISYAPITDAPRVRRQIVVLKNLGWNVVLVGRAGRSPVPVGCDFVELDRIFVRRNHIERAFFAVLLVLSRLSGRLAEWVYWQNSIVKNNYLQMEGVSGDLVVCHDYITVAAGLRVAERTQAALIVDAHEYARGQYMERMLWRYVHRPWIHCLQRRLFARVDGMSTVCDGIADLLHDENNLAERPSVVRSIPSFQECRFRPCGKSIIVLYHGIVASTRGLEQLIASVPLWREEFQLIIRGPGPEEYLEHLRGHIKRLGIAHRVQLQEPVLVGELVSAANEADIGFFVQGDWSPQKRFALPNKFFEYVMAGLALCVSDFPEMGRLVRKHDLGRLVPASEPQSIADAINSFDREAINRFKRHSLDAARDLCWEKESIRLENLIEKVMQARERDLASGVHGG